MDNGAGGIGCYESSPMITRNTIDGNHGGIICERDSDPVISDNRIVSNHGRNNGIYLYDSSALILNNAIQDKIDSTGLGGGIFCNEGPPVIINNIIRGNTVVSDQYNPTPRDGGLYISGSTGIIEHNIISGNYAHDYTDERGTTAGRGGGIYCFASTLTILGKTISANTAGTGLGGGTYSVNCSLVITGNRIHDN